MQRVAMFGICGKMGTAMAGELLKEKDVELVAGFDSMNTGVDLGEYLGTGKKGINKKAISRLAMRAARQFIRAPQRTGVGFVSKGSSLPSFDDISELNQDADRITPSGFISKQRTSAERASALNRIG